MVYLSTAGAREPGFSPKALSGHGHLVMAVEGAIGLFHAGHKILGIRDCRRPHRNGSHDCRRRVQIRSPPLRPLAGKSFAKCTDRRTNFIMVVERFLALNSFPFLQVKHLCCPDLSLAGRIIRTLSCDRYIMHMALAQASR